MKWAQKVVISFVVVLFAGASSVFPVLGATGFDSNGLWLEMAMTNAVAQTNTYVWTNKNGVVRTNTHVSLTYYASAFVIHEPETSTNGVYDLLAGRISMTRRIGPGWCGIFPGRRTCW